MTGFVTAMLDYRRGRRAEEDDPEEKRTRFLERNRAAASRCRARKKLWVDNLEKKAKELEVQLCSVEEVRNVIVVWVQSPGWVLPWLCRSSTPAFSRR